MKSNIATHPIEEAMHILSGRWRLVIAYCLLDGPKRFSDLQRDLPGISPRMLTVDLKKLEEGKVVIRTVYPEVPTRVKYQLTPGGLALRSIINDLYIWGQHIKEEQTKPEIASLIPSPAE